ncbi:apolipoprotein N-acyltransferase [Candidatus Pelagibacter sp. RS39]|uniref:apolipoprotein N-acyltransferase n=1 Tax=Candidatus Pelagibacter sp. RS39 TaxID=1977864 RepID=UPI000A148BAD|nr:apolipoprotein N-acyltransferase [Candidatus Pelagibacter sp. RS39]ARJ47335.1 apolipoprotein N-acyltransferase [Candidatus Pelagibacter sp. RS39]
MKKKLFIESIILILLGSFSSLSLPPFNYILINFLTFSLLYILLIKIFEVSKNKKLFFLYGWLFGLGYFTSNLYWISISLTFDESFKFLIPFSIVLVPAFLALFYGLASFLFLILKPKKNLSSFFLFSLIFGTIEFIRGTILTGFPWNLIAYSFSNYIEILSINSIIGTYSFNLFCISLFTSTSFLILRDNKKEIIVCILFFIITLSFYFFGSQRLENFNNIKANKLDYKLRVISSNVSIDRFYNDTDPISVINDLIKISSPQKNKKTIFIWPEGILPDISKNQLREYKFLFENEFNQNHILSIGINDIKKEGQIIRYYNSLTIYNHNFEILNSYNKVNLVPFGEFLPFEKMLSLIGLKTITNNYQSYSKGEKRNIIEVNNTNFSVRLLPLICYEIIYSGNIFNNRDFDFIVNISEDGWFGQSIGPHQHFVHSIYRAIESGKYVLRSANNGIAAIVNPLGVVEKQVDLNQSGFADLSQTKKIEPTIFSKYGNKIFAIVILLYIFLIFSFNRIGNE